MKFNDFIANLEDKVNFNGGGIDTNNNIMGPKNKISQTRSEEEH